MTEKITNTQKAINRREMLKKGALAAGGAITAAAFLDGKWLKPVVKTGVLPVHAQASMCEAYDFRPFFTWNEEDEVNNLGVNVLPIGPDGPISYDPILAAHTHNIDVTFIGNPVTDYLSILINGTANLAGGYTLNVTGADPTITVTFHYDGCDYTQTYAY